LKKSEIEFNNELRHYILSVSLREPDVLARLRKETENDRNAHMLIPPDQGQFMALLVRALGVKNAIEIGTYTGYSALCVALALPQDGRIVTCDIDNDSATVGKKYWKEAGIADRIDFRHGPALTTIETLLASGQAGTFDFAFIDADKANYIRYYEAALSLLRPGGVLAIDNVLLFGAVIDPSVLSDYIRSRITEAGIAAVRELNEKIGSDPRVDMSMLPIADGLTLVRKL